ncbi:hypothetical protein BO94DRAFT_528295 [Aspergillus sclerotioniger CBS 115572]|uniref:Pre-mRNA-splicing factor 38B n=1 Tax=Aspergillus sclerotioniger CBS 115572 TaxID=1450535 RepID=A0A317V335_9EURO|nr:hypothetical protein BO94DRAFT_528295 [Aspergillus sclerotioniger CBS 115572]PWY67257.1 hypothetical protein BO94DRAFT_528295 [Aspergillus sclerotioniger CBS 115572]
MPPNTAKAIDDPSDDAYVAQVLAREARDSSLKYSAHGLEAYMPRRPTGAAPKPNTRFLRNIIRETDNHNAALKRKEEREARERMRQLKAQGSSASSQDAKREQRRSQRTSDDRESRHERRRDREGKSSSHRRRHRSRSGSTERDQSHRSRRRREAKGTDDDRHRHSRKSRRDRSYSRSRSRSPEADREADSHSRRRRYRSRYESLSRSRSRSPEASDRQRNKDSERRSHRSPREHESSKRRGTTIRKKHPPPRTPLLGNSASDNESDPLEDLVGPLPAKVDNRDYPAPIRSRGRGAYKPNTSNIDAHFAPDYDPTTDVHLENDDGQAGSRSTRRPVPGLMNGDDDWELALEALRDRARWKQRGEERLREAGFSNEFVDRWKTNTTSTPGEDPEGRLEDVKWSKKGEGREWDRGKFVDEDGHIDVKASW